MPPSISVIMPVRNGAALLGRAIRSLLRQTCPDWELIAVDDCSSDGSAEMLKAWADRDPRIRLVRLPENSGPGAARNASLLVAQGRMIAYLDHDDEYFPDYLEAAMRHRGKGDVLVFGHSSMGTTRRNTTGGAARPASTPCNGIPAAWPRSIASSSVGSRISPASRWCLYDRQGK